MRSGEAGYVSVYVALVASLVLVPMLFFAIDLATMAYYRVKLKNTADAVAIAAVAESSSWHIPIPTEWIGWFPVNGWLLNGIHLKNLEPSIGLGSMGGKSKVRQKLRALADRHQEQVGLQVQIQTVGPAQVYPIGNLFSPYMYVEVPVQADLRLNTPFLSRALGQKGGQMTMTGASCAVAWYRVDSWAHKWWDLKDTDAFVKTIDLVINVKNEPHKYYRLVNCVDEASDAISLAESVITEHLKLQDESVTSPWDYLRKQGKGEAREIIDQWRSNGGGQPMKRARGFLERRADGACRAGDPCIDESAGSAGGWAAREMDRRRAEAEAEKAREEAIRKAREAQQQAVQQRQTN